MTAPVKTEREWNLPLGATDPNHSLSSLSSPSSLHLSSLPADNLSVKVDQVAKDFLEPLKGDRGYQPSKSFWNSYKLFESRYASWSNYFKNVGGNLRVIRFGAEYIELNEEVFERVSLSIGQELYKWVEVSSLLILSFSRSSVLKRLRREFEEQVNSFEKLKIQLTQGEANPSYQHLLASIQKQMDMKKRQIERDIEEASYKLNRKTLKFSSKFFVIPLKLSFDLAHKIAHRICKYTFSTLNRCYQTMNILQIGNQQRERVYHAHTHLRVEIKEDRQNPDKEEKCSSSSQKLNAEWDAFKLQLFECKTLIEVEVTLKTKGISTFHLPATLDQWRLQMGDKRVMKQLFHSFCQAANKQSFISPQQIEERLARFVEERKKKILSALSFIDGQIKYCKDENFDFQKASAHFESLHINLKSIETVNTPIRSGHKIVVDKEAKLPLPPKNQEEWEQCLLTAGFREALAEKWVDFQEATAQLSLQAARQMLISKNRVENRFFQFRLMENAVSIATSLFQLSIFFMNITWFVALSIFELLVTDITKFGIPGIQFLYLGHPLYPDRNFKLDSLVMQLAEHFFAINYKPNEYSLEGYKLHLQVRWQFLAARVHQFTSVIQQMILWLNIRLIENCILRMPKKPFEKDDRYKNIHDKMRVDLEIYKSRIKELETRIQELRVKDSNLYLSSEGEKKEGLLADFTDFLARADFNYFPAEVKEFFQDHFGLDLKEVNKSKLLETLNEFFSLGEDKFVEQWQDNSFSHLRV